MIATVVFAVVALSGGAHPQYSIIQEVKTETGVDAYKACKQLVAGLNVTDEERSKVACLELVLHDNKNESYERTIPPNNSRRLGNTTSYEALNHAK